MKPDLKGVKHWGSKVHAFERGGTVGTADEEHERKDSRAWDDTQNSLNARNGINNLPVKVMDRNGRIDDNATATLHVNNTLDAMQKKRDSQ